MTCDRWGDVIILDQFINDIPVCRTAPAILSMFNTLKRWRSMKVPKLLQSGINPELLIN